MLLIFLTFLIIRVPVLVNVAFVTLLDRKIIGYSQARKGPNKVSFIGVLQPFSDAIKLFIKEVGRFEITNTKIYVISPLVGFRIILLIWNLYPLEIVFTGWKISWIALLVGIRLRVYPLFRIGWGSNCVYSYIGGIRGVAQVISYDVVFTILIFVFILLGRSYTMIIRIKFRGYFLVYILSPLLIFMWFIVGLAEINRTPFVFSEGESELVSGFNTEYGRRGFALIFMAEYASIIFSSSLFGVLIVNKRSVLFYIIIRCGWFFLVFFLLFQTSNCVKDT